jgi:anti-sigma factor RsiW
MKCEVLCEVLPAYILGELSEESASECDFHIETCESCRSEVMLYRSLVGEISDAPTTVVTRAESRALLAELEKLPSVKGDAQRSSNRPMLELIGFAAASIAVFAIILYKTILAGGVIAVVDRINPVVAISGAATLVIATALFPIVFTAWRKPLNGMTFRR